MASQPVAFNWIITWNALTKCDRNAANKMKLHWALHCNTTLLPPSPLSILFPLLSPLLSLAHFACASALWGLVTNERKNVTHTINCIKCKKYCCLFDLLLLIVNSQRQCCPCCPVKHTLRPIRTPLPTLPLPPLRTHARLTRGNQNGWQLNAFYCMPGRGKTVGGEGMDGGKGMGYLTHNAGHWPWAPT